MKDFFRFFFRPHLRLEIESLKEYFTTIERAMEREKDDFEKFVSKEVAELSDEDRERVLEDCASEAGDLIERFPSIVRSSYLVTLCSLLERHLWSICKHLQKARGYSLGVEDIKGTGVFAVHTYLTKQCKVAFPDGSEQWAEIVNFLRVRDLIVHDNAHLGKEGENPEVREYIAGSNTINVDHLGQMRLTFDFCLDAARTIEVFFGTLIGVLPTLE